MMRKVVALITIACVALILFYISRFWGFRLWSNEGLLGINELRPQGGLLQRWLRGTPLAPYELLIWALGSFLILTWLEKIFARLKRSPTGDGSPKKE